MLSPVTTTMLNRLRANDQAAWFELWETFGPVVQAQLAKWGRGRVGVETARDLSQETLAALSNSIERFDPKRGVRFSTWLLAIARHVLGDELDRRGALKRGAAQRAASIDETWMIAGGEVPVDEQYEASVFRAKVEAAIRLASRECAFEDFSVYQSRVLEGKSGKEVAESLGISEPTVSRRVGRVRDVLRARLMEVVAAYSFTPDESAEAGRVRGGTGSSNAAGERTPADDQMFDEAVAEIYQVQTALRREQANRAKADD